MPAKPKYDRNMPPRPFVSASWAYGQTPESVGCLACGLFFFPEKEIVDDSYASISILAVSFCPVRRNVRAHGYGVSVSHE